MFLPHSLHVRHVNSFCSSMFGFLKFCLLNSALHILSGTGTNTEEEEEDAASSLGQISTNHAVCLEGSHSDN